MSEIMAVSAARGAYRETADGSLEVKIIIDPRYKDDFHRLFRDKDMPVALAPLVANFEQIKPDVTNPGFNSENVTKPIIGAASLVTSDKPKGGELAKWAGILSNDPVFWEWADECCDFLDIKDATDAAIYIREMCNISSRAELDHNPEAAKIFRDMMGEFDDWKNRGKAA